MHTFLILFSLNVCTKKNFQNRNLWDYFSQVLFFMRKILLFADFEETQMKQQQQQQQVQQMGKGNNGNWHEKFAQWNLNN